MQISKLLSRSLIYVSAIFLFSCNTIFANQLDENAINSNSLNTLNVIPDKSIDDDVHTPEATILYSGVTNGITWSVDSSYHLTATGRQEMYDSEWYITELLEEGDYATIEKICPWYSIKDKIVTADVSVKNASSICTWFSGNKSLTSINLSGTELGDTDSLGGLFYNCEKLKKVNFGSNFDTSKIEYMHSMFSYCHNLTELNGFETLNTSNVQNFKQLFYECYSLNSIDLSKLDVSSATDISYLLNSCYNITDVKFFKGNTGNITNAIGVFGACIKLKNIDFSGYDFHSLETFENMFAGCSSLESVSFKDAKLNSLVYLRAFSNCSKLQFVDMSGCYIPMLGDNNRIQSLYWYKLDKMYTDEELERKYLPSIIFDKSCSNVKEFRTPYGFSGELLFLDNYQSTSSSKFKDENGTEYTKIDKVLTQSITLKRNGGYSGSAITKNPTPDLGEIVFSDEQLDTINKVANGKIYAKITRTNFTYTGKEMKPTVSVTYKYSYYDDNGVLSTKIKSKKLKKDVDFAISYENNIDASNNGAFVVLEGLGDYKGTIKLPFTIKQRAARYLTMDFLPDISLSTEEFAALNDGDTESSGIVQAKVYDLLRKTVSENTVVYDGAKTISGNQYSYEISPIKVKKNIKSVVVQIVKSKDNIETGKNYTFEKGASRAKTTIYLADSSTRNNFEECTVRFNSIKSYKTNGRLIKPGVSVIDKDGKKVASKNFKVIYRNNVNPGTATVYVIGKSGYIGKSNSISFEITEKK